MKRRAFIRDLVKHGCFLKRHGARHDLYQNSRNGKKAPVPRHAEIGEDLCREIRKQLEIGE
ncbi:MAG: type II toxin-antitoxin system HicA family toxin [Candidatus Omnitrophica bacterium]|nr:type II toxin-antitoxin system HicA family toxin [Candidatus Omnitrophota bacterium]